MRALGILQQYFLLVEAISLNLIPQFFFFCFTQVIPQSLLSSWVCQEMNLIFTTVKVNYLWHSS